MPDQQSDNMKKVLVIGATSAIAHETAKKFAAERSWLFLVARHREKLATIADDLRVRGAGKIETFLLDVNEFGRHSEMLTTATKALGGLDFVLIAHGTLSNQRLCEQHIEETLKELATNCLSVISLLTHIANYFEQQRRGCIAVITSVAGDRGRQSNYVYGTAKAAINTFLQGLRNRLAKSGVAVVTIKPGFVDTPMTASLSKNFLFASARSVGEGIYHALLKGKDVVYLPGFWRWIMLIIKSIPEGIFKRMRL
jgi:short-subunit dehydrogenase